jgi:hypothetical protein
LTRHRGCPAETEKALRRPSERGRGNTERHALNSV